MRVFFCCMYTELHLKSREQFIHDILVRYATQIDALVGLYDNRALGRHCHYRIFVCGDFNGGFISASERPCSCSSAGNEKRA